MFHVQELVKLWQNQNKCLFSWIPDSLLVPNSSILSKRHPAKYKFEAHLEGLFLDYNPLSCYGENLHKILSIIMGKLSRDQFLLPYFHWLEYRRLHFLEIPSLSLKKYFK